MILPSKKLLKTKLEKGGSFMHDFALYFFNINNTKHDISQYINTIW